eukprot:Rmarinus@m.1685
MVFAISSGMQLLHRETLWTMPMASPDFYSRLWGWSSSECVSLRMLSIGLLSILFEDGEIANNAVSSSLSSLGTLVNNLHELQEHVGSTPMSTVSLPRVFEDDVPEETRILSMHALIYRYSLAALSRVGEYTEMLPYIDAPEMIPLLLKVFESPNTTLVLEGIQFAIAIVAHKKLAREFVERDGMQALLRMPRTPYLASSVASLLFGLSTVPAVMEKICGLPAPTPALMVQYAVWVTGMPQATAKKNISLFLAHAFAYRKFLHFFDKGNGVAALIDNLNVQFLLGLKSNNLARHLMLHTAHALRQYFRAHLVLLADGFRERANARQQITHERYISGNHGHDFETPVRTVRNRRESAPHPPPPSKAAGLLASTPATNHGNSSSTNGPVTPPTRGSAGPGSGPGAASSTSPAAVFSVAEEAAGGAAAGSRPVMAVERVVSPARKRHRGEAINVDPVNVESGMQLLVKNRYQWLAGFHWIRVEEFLRADGLTKLLSLMAQRWVIPEVVQYGLEILDIVTLLPVTHEPFLNTRVEMRDVEPVTAVKLLLEAAATRVGDGPDTIKAALQVLCNLVCRLPWRSLHRDVVYARAVDSKSTFQSEMNNWAPDGLRQGRCEVRSNNGIKVLLYLLKYKTHLSFADSIRALSCQALLGLAKEPSICRFLADLEVSSTISELMRQPVAAECEEDHQFFKYCAMVLLSRTTGRPEATISSEAGDPAMRKLEKADVVAHTHISYDRNELMLLIYDHLQKNGLTRAAKILAEDADLNVNRTIGAPAFTPPKPHNPFGTFLVSPVARQKPSAPGAVTTPSSVLSVPPIPSMVGTPPHRPTAPATASTSLPSFRSQSGVVSGPGRPFVSGGLDQIVCEFLRNQHRHCTDPVTVLPPLSLFKQHQCDIKKDFSHYGVNAQKNVADRIMMRQHVRSPHGGTGGAARMRRLVYSRFRSIRLYHPPSEESAVVCSAFACKDTRLIVGNYTGQLHVYDIGSSESVATHVTADSPLRSVQISHALANTRACIESVTGQSRLSKRLLLCSSREDVRLYDFDDMQSYQYALPSMTSASFSNANDRIVATWAGKVYVVNTETGSVCNSLELQTHVSSSCWSALDDMVLTDGVLWDPRRPCVVHKFDKLHSTESGCFDPSGLDVIVNSEVYDLRTFKLRKTCRSLDGATAKFNNGGDVIYGYVPLNTESDIVPHRLRKKLSQSFRTLDATSYADIASVELADGGYVVDVAVDKSDYYIAATEFCDAAVDDVYNSRVRLYEIGRKRPTDMDSDLGDDESEESDMRELTSFEGSSLGSEGYEVGDDVSISYAGDDIDVDPDVDIDDDDPIIGDAGWEELGDVLARGLGDESMESASESESDGSSE